MNDNHLIGLCHGKKWDEIREFLDSDSTNNNDKKRQFVCYRGEWDDYTCLHHACCYKGAPPVDIIKSLLDIGGKELVMMTDSDKNTALHFACDNGVSFDVMKMLIDVGGKELVVAKNSSNGDTALHYLCYHINRHTNAATNKIEQILQVADTETILTEKNDNGYTPLDYAIRNKANNKIKRLLQPRTINKIDSANINDDASNLVPDDHDNDTSITELQNQLQAANQKIADLESHRAEHVLLATRHQDQLQAANQKNADLENEIENQNALLSEQSANRLQDQAAYQKKIADLDDKIETHQTEYQRKIAHLSKETSEEKAIQDTEITYWKGRADIFTDICSEQKAELQQLKESSRHQDQLQATRNQKFADLENEIENKNVLLSEQAAHRLQDQSASQKILNAEKNNGLLSEQKAEQEKEIAFWKGRVNNLTEICYELKVELQQLKDSTRISIANIKRERDNDDDVDPSTQARSSKTRSRVESTTHAMHV